MDTHRRRSSHNGQSSGSNNTNATASMGDNSDAFETAASDIYSGVDLARLAAAGQQHQLAAVAMAAAAAKHSLAEMDSLEPQNLGIYLAFLFQYELFADFLFMVLLLTLC